MGSKTILISIFLMTTQCGFSQDTDSLELSYQGGFQKINQLILYEMSNSDVAAQDSFYKKPYLFYQVIFEVDKKGNIEDVWLNSLYDTSLLSSLWSAIRKSSGSWINHTNKKLLVVLPVYYNIINQDTAGNGTLKEIAERIDNSESLKISDRYYHNGSPGQVVHLKPVKIVAFSPVH